MNTLVLVMNNATTTTNNNHNNNNNNNNNCYYLYISHSTNHIYHMLYVKLENTEFYSRQ